MKNTKLVFAALFSLTLVLSACSSDELGDPGASGTTDPGGTSEGGNTDPDSEPEPEPLTPEEITAAIFAGVDPETLAPGEKPERVSGKEMISPEVVAQVSGRLETTISNAPEITAQFAAVEAFSDKTIVRYSMRSSNGEKQGVPTIHGLKRSLASEYLDGVALVDENIENIRLFPLYAQIPDSPATQCLCSPVPNGFTPNDHWFYGIYPALDPSVETVKIELEGLEPTEVPVVWAEG